MAYVESFGRPKGMKNAAFVSISVVVLILIRGFE